MRFLVFMLCLALSGCINSLSRNANLAQHCPRFQNSNWQSAVIPQPQRSQLINKQKFAIPSGYQTLWFESKRQALGLCIIPDRKNRGSSYGCGSAYAIYNSKQGKWQLKDQKVTICST